MLNKRFSKALPILLLPIFGNVSAEMLTAICEEPRGRILGRYGDLGNSEEVDDTDSISGGLITISWNSKEKTAQVVYKGSDGQPYTSSAFPALITDEQATFIVLYPKAIWIYSLYPQIGKLLMTQHTNGSSLGSGGAIGKLMQAQCTISTG